MQAAGITAASNIEMSSHLMPELSVHLLAATSTAHWIKYVDEADAILEEPLELVEGAVSVPVFRALGSAGSRGSGKAICCFPEWAEVHPTLKHLIDVDHGRLSRKQTAMSESSGRHLKQAGFSDLWDAQGNSVKT